MKRSEQYLQLLQHSIQNLIEADKWLQRSFSICQTIGIKDLYSLQEFDAFENLTSRFARTCDCLIKKVYRGIDQIELENTGTLIDVMNRADKRGLLNSIAELREIKELRNTISHEYANTQLKEIFEAVFNHTPALFSLVEKAQQYCGALLTHH